MTNEKEIQKEEERPMFAEYEVRLMENPMVIESLLIPLEYFCLLNAINNVQPMTTRDYYKLNLRSIYSIVYEDTTEVRYPIVINRDTFERRTLKSRPQRSAKHPNIHSKRILSSKDVAEMEAILRREDIDFPSYSKVKRTLESLENWGFLSVRAGHSKNEKVYWVLSPRFPLELREALLEYNKQRQEQMNSNQ